MIDAIATISIAVIAAFAFWTFVLHECGMVGTPREDVGCEGVGEAIGEEEWE